MKVIIVGLGKFGRTVLEFLANENHDIVAIDKDAQKVQTIVDRYDVMGVCGNGCMAENLKEAGVSSADMLVAVTPSDEQNVLCSLIAKNMGVRYVIARVRDPEYNEQAEFMREKFGIDRFVNPERALAEEITRILRFPSAERIYTFADGKVEIVETKLRKSCPLIGLSLREIGAKNKRSSVLIAAVEREGKIIIPNGDTELCEGDIVSVCAKHLDLYEFFKEYGLLKKQGQYVMILGAERMAHYLVRDLIKCGFRVKVVSPYKDRCQAISQAVNGVSVICGDFTDKEILEEEGIEDADAIVAMTAYDENNVMISLFGKQKEVPKIVTVLRNGSYSGIIDELGLSTAISPYTVVAEDTVRCLRSLSVADGEGLVALYKIAGEGAEAMQFKVNGHKELTGKALKELSNRFQKGILVTAIVRGKTFVVPKGDTVIQADDTVIIVSEPNKKISCLDDILR